MGVHRLVHANRQLEWRVTAAGSIAALRQQSQTGFEKPPSQSANQQSAPDRSPVGGRWTAAADGIAECATSFSHQPVCCAHRRFVAFPRRTRLLPAAIQYMVKCTDGDRVAGNAARVRPRAPPATKRQHAMPSSLQAACHRLSSQTRTACFFRRRPQW